ncbi:LemA family protein [Intestinibacillus sp. Marseille-P6563]|mgnify:FL=1|uniref:LemA family protein n=1 Tax=Intestinibacillus sp. Marseille-P6563 TaxID=2364792 RepID=UPI000F06017E|nr:LemA family protein [Intestinibacillus sp. Marseille-P6563]
MPYVLIGIAILILLGIIFIAIYNRLQQLQIKIEEAGSGIDIALEKRYDLLSEQLAVVKKYLSHEYDTLTDVTALRSGTAGEERRLDLQQELSTEAVRSIDAEISRQSRSMEEIRHQLDRSRFSRPNAGKHGAQNHARQEQNNLSQVTGFRQNAFNQKIRTLADAHRSLSGIAAGIDALCEQYPLLNSWISIDQFQRSISNTEEYLQAARRLYNSNVSLYNQTVRTIPWSIVASLFHMEEASFYEAEEHKRSFQVSFD